MISVGDEVFVADNEKFYYAKLCEVSLTDDQDIVEDSSGKLIRVNRNCIFPKSYTEKIEISEILDELKLGICEVVFEKTNGNIRIMSCTLNEFHFPDDVKKTQNKNNKYNEDVICSWDVIKEDWRSFRVKTIKSFKRLTGKNRGNDNV